MEKPQTQSMIIYPAIDLLDGRCVRLLQGRYNQVTVYNEDPLAVAESFQEAGAQWIHVVDLNAAKSGRSTHRKTIAAIKERTGMRVQTGGGIRDMATIEDLLQTDHLDRLVLGTAAVRDRKMTRQALDRFADRIAIGVDARDDRVCVDGWTTESGLPVLSFVETMAEAGAQHIIYTDISRDGTLQGPPLEMIHQLVELGIVNVVASGGIGSHQDIESVRQTGAAGVIVGKAIYEGKVVLEKCWQKG